MSTFTQPLWGYHLTYPSDWIHQTSSDIEAFAAHPKALQDGYAGFQAGHLLLRCEFNHTGESIDPLWNQHLIKLALMVGAKNVGAAPLQMGGGSGYEAEIVLPKKKQRRLWTGILTYGLTILHISASHPLENRDWFEPLGSRIVASLRFLSHVPNLPVTDYNIPLPPGYVPTDPTAILRDIKDPQHWRAFIGRTTMDTLQAFYLRELPHYGWEISELTPFPSRTDLSFARFKLINKDRVVTLGIFPSEDKQPLGIIVIKQ